MLTPVIKQVNSYLCREIWSNEQLIKNQNQTMQYYIARTLDYSLVYVPFETFHKSLWDAYWSKQC